MNLNKKCFLFISKLRIGYWSVVNEAVKNFENRNLAREEVLVKEIIAIRKINISGMH